MLLVYENHCDLHQTVPKPWNPWIQKSIWSLNSSTVRPAIFLGNVMDNSQVDAVGKRFSSVNLIFGTESNPVAGTLDDPVKKVSTSPTLVSSLSAQSDMYSYYEKTMFSSCVRLFDPLKEYSTTNESQRNFGVISYIFEAASNLHTSFA